MDVDEWGVGDVEGDVLSEVQAKGLAGGLTLGDGAVIRYASFSSRVFCGFRMIFVVEVEFQLPWTVVRLFGHAWEGFVVVFLGEFS